MSVLGSNVLFKPALRLGSRLFASQTERTKAVGNDQLHVLPPRDADCVPFPMAPYHRNEALQQFPNSHLANNFVMMQPVLVPVFSPLWGMQSSAEPQHTISSQVPSTTYPQEATESPVHQQRRQRRSRRGGAAMRKKLDRAMEMVAAQKSAAEVTANVAVVKDAVEKDAAASFALAKADAAPKAAAEKDAVEKDAAASFALAKADAAPKAAAEKASAEKVATANTSMLAEKFAAETVMMSLAGVAQGGWTDMMLGRSGPNSTPGRWADYGEEGKSSRIHATTATLDVVSADVAEWQGTSTMMCEEDANRLEAAIDPFLLELDSPNETSRQSALDWVANSFWPLALTKRGCRIVQKAIDVGSPAYKKQLVENLHGRVSEAVKSPHTNYVLQKFIETMPPERMQFVMAELQGEGPNVSRHRFGCRIVQRLIEHCTPAQTEPLINEILGEAASLCLHQYGNFSIQHILQYGSPAQRSSIAHVIEADMIRLAKHRIASHVVSSAMVHCPEEDVQRLTQTVIRDSGKLAHLSRREYGSFVVREVNRAARKLRPSVPAVHTNSI